MQKAVTKKDSRSKPRNNDAAKCARIFDRHLLNLAGSHPSYIAWNELWYRCDTEKVRNIPVRYIWEFAEFLARRAYFDHGHLEFFKGSEVEASGHLEFDIPDWEAETEPMPPPPQR